MQIRKWLALLVSAALALSLLAGCGGESVASALLKLLDGRYPNISIEIDPELEVDLRQAVHEGETDAEIRAALEKILGSGVNFRLIGDGQQGDSAWNLILYPGNDPDAAARSAFTEWDKVFGSLPRDGQYSAGLAMLETENGYAILVKATVDKAASRDDDDDEPEDKKVEGNGFTYNVTKNTITVEPDSEEPNGQQNHGLQNLLTGQDNEAQEITAARSNGFEKIIITLNGTYSVNDTFETPFKGTLQGGSKESTTINIAGGNGLFAQIADDGKVENITFDVETNITNTFTPVGNSCAGAVAGSNHGTITNCEVKLNGHTIKASSSDPRDFVNAGGLVGYNYGTITNCTVTINGPISATSNYIANAGGIAGDNEGKGEIKGNSQVTIESGGSIRATGTGDTVDRASAGGIVGQNVGTVDEACSFEGSIPKTITAKVGDNEASVPNNGSNTDKKLDDNNIIKASAGTKIGYNWTVGSSGPVGE